MCKTIGWFVCVKHDHNTLSSNFVFWKCSLQPLVGILCSPPRIWVGNWPWRKRLVTEGKDISALRSGKFPFGSTEFAYLEATTLWKTSKAPEEGLWEKPPMPHEMKNNSHKPPPSSNPQSSSCSSHLFEILWMVPSQNPKTSRNHGSKWNYCYFKLSEVIHFAAVE